MCHPADRSRASRCTCGVEPGEDLGALRGVVAHRLARAWVSLGCGGLILFTASTILAAHYSWVVASIASVGGALVVRGLRVVSKTRRNLLVIAQRAALPAARIVP